jgi:xanthine dehydrogenase accessory factor
MKEIRDIIRAFDEAQKKGKQTALATVVHVDGSAYRRPGARMLITEDGELTGAISGGCLEGDALRKALFVLNRQKSMLVTYDTTDEDDAKLGVGLGCNGIIQVLIEPVDPLYSNNPIQLLKNISGKRQEAVLATLFSLQNKRDDQPGTCLLLKDDEMISLLDDSNPFKQFISADAKNAVSNKKSSFKNYVQGNQNLTAFIEFIKPAISLVVVGAGNDVVPLIEMAAILGWQITVADGRSGYIKQERFASSCQVLLSKPGNLLEKIRIDEQTAFVLMTHNYNYDIAVLKELIKKNPVYIGSLGPRKKIDRMIGELEEEGINLSAEQLKNIYGPSGLDIGAETPEEIALSILSEIKAVFSNKEGKMLRDREDVIHPRSETHIEKASVEK